ncbi:MAG: hypothetical protein EZS28_017609 [Streblomastix strix]|uniref:RNase H type-1 domain-containing protein n=1 Tax=Streblomastix strix TaxID=222440 RepID=A0A5J4VWA9_9EUKA|nr:MAG: hypothetical protein EZS28_017609 [Streblomastix strix]
MEMIFTTFHIKGKSNQVADALSRLSTSGDYEIRQEVLQEALRVLDIKPTIDVFANRCYRNCRRFCSIINDRWTVEQDDFKQNWKNEITFLHPLIILIQRVLNKVIKDHAQAVLVVPNWEAKHWWPSFHSAIANQVLVGKCADILVQDWRMMKKQRLHPPGDLLVAKIKGIKEKNSSMKQQDKELQVLIPSKILSKVGMQFREDIDREQDNLELAKKRSGKTWKDLRLIEDCESEPIKNIIHLYQIGSTSNNIVEIVAALALLFQLSGFKEVQIKQSTILDYEEKQCSNKESTENNEDDKYTFNICSYVNQIINFYKTNSNWSCQVTSESVYTLQERSCNSDQIL